VSDRFSNWKYPDIEDGKPTKYNWVVQNLDGFKLGFKTDIGAFSYINAKKGVTIEDEAQKRLFLYTIIVEGTHNWISVNVVYCKERPLGHAHKCC
jgi:hypothetical protein